MAEQQVNENQVRAFLQPIAAPSILGLYGFAGSTLIVAAWLAGWYGNPDTLVYLVPFTAIFGGVAQLSAGLWAYKARDGIATAMHGMWGSFWIGLGFLEILTAAGVIPRNEGAFPALAWWFCALAWITFMGAIAATFENASLAVVLHTLWIASALYAIGEFTGTPPGEGITAIAGYVFIISAIAAWYTASALMFAGVGRPILPVGETKHAQREPAIAPGAGEPGVMKGQ
ncbi:MAG: acetate uptake transporter [Actinomycetota bacterium]|jgi:succinate-acetate transporter protein|nr:acetate uptake transporter [Actinomycetota bacterium]